MKQIILSVVLLLNCCNTYAMQFDNEDLSPFDSTVNEKVINFKNLKFTHKSKSTDLTHGASAQGTEPECRRSIYKIAAHAITYHVDGKTSEDKKVGFIEIDGDDRCSFLRLHVYQFARGNGVGKKLLEQALAWSKAQGCTHVSGVVYDFKREYYEKMGAECNLNSYYSDGLTHCRYDIPEDKV